jgi:hypothetical protein
MLFLEIIGFAVFTKLVTTADKDYNNGSKLEYFVYNCTNEEYLSKYFGMHVMVFVLFVLFLTSHLI